VKGRKVRILKLIIKGESIIIQFLRKIEKIQKVRITINFMITNRININKIIDTLSSIIMRAKADNSMITKKDTIINHKTIRINIIQMIVIIAILGNIVVITTKLNTPSTITNIISPWFENTMIIKLIIKMIGENMKNIV